QGSFPTVGWLTGRVGQLWMQHYAEKPAMQKMAGAVYRHGFKMAVAAGTAVAAGAALWIAL
ncbi:hypothetical protein KIPB_014726, partial [Kipferlia bialata]